MALDIESPRNAIQSHLQALGDLKTVVAHEAKNASVQGMTAELWLELIQPIAKSSGLAVTSVRLEFSLRLRHPMQSEPQDRIDIALGDAAALAITALSGDFNLGGTVDHIDLLGAYGTPLGGRAGYLQQDGTLFRVMAVTIPLIIHNVFTQAV